MSNLRTPFQTGFGSGGARLTDGVLKKNIAQVRDEFDVLINRSTSAALSAGVKATATLADLSANTLRLDALMPGDSGNKIWYETLKKTVGGASVFDLTVYAPDLSTTLGKRGYTFETTHASELCTYGTIAAPESHGWITGDGPFRLETATTLPTGYATTSLYWIIKVAATTFQLALTKALAVAGTAVTISDDGTGAHRIFPMTTEVFGNLSTTITAERYMEKVVNGELGTSFTAATTDICTTASAHNMVSGDGPYRVGTTTTIPTGLSELLEYYIIAADTEPTLSTTTFALATTKAAALTGIAGAVNISSTGSGTHRLYKVDKEVGSLGSNWVTAQDLLSGTTDDRPADTTYATVLASGANEITATGVNRGDYVVRALNLTTPALIAPESFSCTAPDKIATTAGISASLYVLFTVRPKP